MRKILAVCHREFRSYFHIPMALIVLPSFLALTGFYFYTCLVNFQLQVVPRAGIIKVEGININDHLLVPFFNQVIYVLMLVVPVVTMRLVAEEKRAGTWELLLTYPVRSWEVLVGKYLGALFFMFLLLLLTLPFPASLFLLGRPELPIIASTYLGIILFIIFYVACGLWSSLITENQVIAALICFGISLGFIVLRWLAAVSPPPFEDFFAHLLLIDHIANFSRGIIQFSYVLIFPSMTALVLLACFRQMDKRR